VERSTTNTLLKLALYAGAAYVGYKYLLKPFLAGLDKLGKLGQQVTEPVANAISSAYLWWTLPPPIGVTGQFVLQDSGAFIDPTSVKVTWINSDAAFDPRAANYNGQLPTIVYRGITYVLGPHDANGNYPAVRL
jgi:hypothetical protein